MHCNADCWKNLWSGGAPTLIVGLLGLLGVIATLWFQWRALKKTLKAQAHDLKETFEEQERQLRQGIEREASSARIERLRTAVDALHLSAVRLAKTVASQGAAVPEMRHAAGGVLDQIANVSHQIELIPAPGPKLILDAAVVVQRALDLTSPYGQSNEQQRALLVEPAEVLIATCNVWLRTSTVPESWTWDSARAEAPSFDWVAAVRRRLGIGAPGDTL